MVLGWRRSWRWWYDPLVLFSCEVFVGGGVKVDRIDVLVAAFLTLDVGVAVSAVDVAFVGVAGVIVVLMALLWWLLLALWLLLLLL